MTTDANGVVDEAELDRAEARRREELALELMKYLPWCLITGAAMLGIIWILERAYVQLLLYSALLVANAAVVWLSGRMFRAGRSRAAAIIFGASFLIHLGSVPMFLPETFLEMTVGYMLVLLLAGLVLGARSLAWAAIFCTAALVADVIFGPAFQARFITPLPPRISTLISLVLMAFQMLLDGYVLYLVLGAQEKLYRKAQAQSASLSAARQQLIAVNEGLEQRVRDQVREIVSRAEEVESLNAQLQIKVQERSRELVKALSALGAETTKAFAPGKVFAERVRIERPLGHGGMGTVFMGKDLATNRTVALKVMNPTMTGDPRQLQRFLSEANASAAVSHPAVVRTLHVDVTSEGVLYLIMEYVDGVTLSHKLMRGALPPGHVARFGACIAEALAAAHDVGIIHRDIKPGNLMLSRLAPGVRLLDFGISVIQRDTTHGLADTATMSAQMIGTPHYMSPEQVRDADRVTAKTDVYSLGAVLFEAVSGRLLFPLDSVGALCTAHLHEQPVPLRSIVSDVHGKLSDLVASCLQKDAARRPDARTLGLDLATIADELGAPPANEIVKSFDGPATVAS